MLSLLCLLKYLCDCFVCVLHLDVSLFTSHARLWFSVELMGSKHSHLSAWIFVLSLFYHQLVQPVQFGNCMNQSSLCCLPNLWPIVLNWRFLIYAKRSLSCKDFLMNRKAQELKDLSLPAADVVGCHQSIRHPSPITTVPVCTSCGFFLPLLSRVMTKSVVFLSYLSSPVCSLFKCLCAEAPDYLVP